VPNQLKLAFPQPVVSYTRYLVQYGADPFWNSPGTTSVITVSVPKQVYSRATLDIIMMNATAPTITLKLDIGNTRTDWTPNPTWQSPIALHSPNLAAYFNSYLAPRPEPAGTRVTVPIAVSLNTTCTLFLTNLALTPGADSDPQVGTRDLTVSNNTPKETDIVTVTATIHNIGAYTATNVMAAFFAGDPATGGALLGSSFMPELAPQGNRSNNIRWDTTGYVGPIDLYVLLDPANQLAELSKSNNSISTTISVRSRFAQIYLPLVTRN
jgi:hypothetical protein